ncbi:metalloregulator ArsR/SmtB family transcription factor [Neptunomonas qingdaonensis]|uniref:ArsR family transcriptional regulator n=1 Tax=Neptunomonas qingdaonensis TaxID=1045558 RepID=A0A1I2MA67_9GAMM|nr:metalloregulator ArsR/SmtB family transcription factor [Neptunomonas qingdaonensis]SFF87820.1 ArsR family transcriptional regulator [Neptunomonas qingdaonensis]
MNPVQFYKCLADETRLKCVLLIEHENELCVCELTEALQEIQPKVSRHLAQLRQCGLLMDRRQGKWIFYRINPDLPEWSKKIITETTLSNTVFLKESLSKLSDMGGRPERMAACC